MLKVLAEHSDGLSVSELAEAMRTHRAGIYRLLGPLSDERLVVRGDGRPLHTRPRAPGAREQVRPRLQEAATRELRSLADELQATTALTVRDGDEAVVLAVVEPRGTTWHLAYRPGLRHRLSVAAPGLAILAGWSAAPGRATGDRDRPRARVRMYHRRAARRGHRRRCTRRRVRPGDGSEHQRRLDRAARRSRGRRRRHPIGPGDRGRAVARAGGRGRFRRQLIR